MRTAVPMMPTAIARVVRLRYARRCRGGGGWPDAFWLFVWLVLNRVVLRRFGAQDDAPNFINSINLRETRFLLLSRTSSPSMLRTLTAHAPPPPPLYRVSNLSARASPRRLALHHIMILLRRQKTTAAAAAAVCRRSHNHNNRRRRLC